MFGSEPMLLHLVTICIGLIIAFGLQQIVDIFLRRRRARQQEADDAKARKSANDESPPPPVPPH